LGQIFIMTNSIFTFETIPKIIFGQNRSGETGQLARQLDIKTAIIISDPGIQAAGLLDIMIESLSEQNISYHIFTEVVADPPEDMVLRAVNFARENQADGIIGIGGGSSLDTAKLVSVLATGHQKLRDIYGVDRITTSPLPLIQIPTTSGTGSEVTPIAIVTRPDDTKQGIISASLYAKAVILDPALTLGLPPQITAATAIDAMVHAIEAFTGIHRKNPVSDMLALQALRLLAENIEDAVHRGNNLAARSAMLLGSMMAGKAFANSPVAAVHALAYPLGGIYHIPHGLSNSLILPHILRFNIPKSAPQYAELAQAVMTRDELSGLHKPEDVAQEFADYFARLTSDLGLPTTLRAMNIPERALPKLAEEAMKQQRLLVNNPREVKYKDALSIYQQAYS